MKFKPNFMEIRQQIQDFLRENESKNENNFPQLWLPVHNKGLGRALSSTAGTLGS
jgi:hypothetical protein